MKRLIFVLVFLLALALYFILPGFTSAAAYAPAVGGTGTTTPPSLGQLLVGNASKTYALTATSSLGLPTFADLSALSTFSTTSSDYWKNQRNFFSTTSADWWKTQNNFFATTSADYWQSLTDFFSTTSAQYFVHSSTTIPKTYSANTWTALQTFAYASTTGISGTYASSTSYYGAGLANCSTGNMLTWTDGRFGCEDDSTGGGAPFAYLFNNGMTFGTSTAATTTSIWAQGVFFSSSTKAASQLPYASTTAITAATASTTSLVVSNTRSALGTFSASGLLSAYAGASSCTNQAMTGFSAVGASTCSSINNAWWSGTDLSVANGGTGLSTFGGSGTILFTTAADTLSSSANLTFASNKLTFLSGSSTNFSASGFLQIPVATAPSLTASGQVAIQTAAASTSVQFRNGGQFGVYASTSVSFIYPTSTPTTASTTEFVQFANRGQAFMSFACRSVGGNATVRIGTGAASSSYAIAVTGTPIPISFTPITFNAWSTMYVEIGSFTTNAVTRVTCGFTKSDIY